MNLNLPHIKMLREIAGNMKPKVYLEIGVREGDSLRATLEVCTPEKVILCDTWGLDAGGTGRKNHNHILSIVQGIKEVKWLDGDSHKLIKLLENDSVDLALIDGDHSAKGAMQDLVDLWPKMKKGGYVVFDDITHPGHKWLKGVAMQFIESVNTKVYKIDEEPCGCVSFSK